ncbi:MULTISPECIES: hypothetical protein [Dickeya]|nr:MULTISPECIES: hypothetical protein [Dickeya]
MGESNELRQARCLHALFYAFVRRLGGDDIHPQAVVQNDSSSSP